MTRSRVVRLYSDYKSPYAFLAKDLAYELEQQAGVKLDWLPYTLVAKRQGVFRGYHDRVFERFWKRELDIESPVALAAVLQECGADTGQFEDFLRNEGRAELAQVQREAEAAGVFGVPSFLLEDGDLYWGREHLPRIRALLED